MTMTRATRAQLVFENDQLRKLLADALHQNKCDARKIMQLKQLTIAPSTGGVLPADRARYFAQIYAKENNVTTRVTHNVVEKYDPATRTWSSV
jgi:hypothetical protein